MKKTNGTLVISLDYELMWGMHDVVTKDGYGNTNIKNVPEVFHRLMLLFDNYNIHATVATVGMIFYNNSHDLLSEIPELKPTYNNSKLSVYENNLIDNIKPDENILFFQPFVIDSLKHNSNIEIATHTFSHYYCQELGQTLEQFDADLSKAILLAKSKDITSRSIVFPRNQVSEDYLHICQKYGIVSYRGNALKYYNQPKSKIDNYRLKFLRSFDSHINIGGNTSYKLSDIDTTTKPYNLRASRLLKPYNNKLLTYLHLRRIKKEIIYASKHNEIYHLWWHPHNFGSDIDKNMWQLEEILKCYQQCNLKYGMVSLTMDELANHLDNNEQQ